MYLVGTLGLLGIKLTKATSKEELSPGYKRSHRGFQLKDLERLIKIDQAVVQSETQFVQNFISIAFFLGGGLQKIA